ncbi:MAG: hypothetical protein ACT4OZ_08015 [Gemmatimonadota bacterium]
MTSPEPTKPVLAVAPGVKRPSAAEYRRAPARGDLHIIVVVNGPGEVAAWLWPLVAAVRERAPATRITVALSPCAFASGAEPEVVAGMEIDDVIPTGETLSWALGGREPQSIERGRGRRGCVLHLGGELLLSAVLSRRCGWPLAIYAEDRVRHPYVADLVCLSDPGVAPEDGRRIKVVGNLMVDAAQMRVPCRRVRDGRPATIALFPGSRLWQVRGMLPFLIRVAGDVALQRDGLRWIIARSNFVSEEMLTAIACSSERSPLEGERALVTSSRQFGGQATVQITSSRGVRLEVRSAAEAMRDADLAVTIPGTNTAELAALGLPMLMLLPTHRLDDVALPGLTGHLGRLPVIGRPLTRLVANSYLRSRRFWAHPNRRSGQMIVPEIVGRFTASDIAARLLALVESDLDAMSAALSTTMGAPGAASRLADELLTLASRK